MQKMIRTLLKASIKIRTLPIYNTLQNHVNFSQDISMHTTLETFAENTNIQNLLNYNNELKSVIETIQQTYKDMDAKQAIQVMDTLKYAIIRNRTSFKAELSHSNEFRHMYQLILDDIKSLSTYDVIRTLQALFILKVPTSSRLVQSLLQLIRASLNDLSVGQIIIIYNMLETQVHIPLIKSIQRAIPKVFTQQAQFELNIESDNLMKALKFSHTINDEKTMVYIINMLNRSKNSIKSKDIVDIFNALCSIPVSSICYTKFLSKIKNVIKTNCQFLSFGEIECLLRLISAKANSTEDLQYYSAEVVDALCNAVLNHNITFRDEINLLRYLNKMLHGNTVLLDDLSSKLLKDTLILKQCSTVHVDFFVKHLIIADYKPPDWERIQALLLDFVRNNHYFFENAASISFRLLSLGIYSPEIVEKAFIMYETNRSEINEQVALYILKLYWCIKLLYPEYTGFMPNWNYCQVTLDELSRKYKKYRDPSLLESLKETLGGVKYIKSDLGTKYGELIEHVIVIQPNGLPMDISNCSADIKFVEELDVPSECSKILFFVLSKRAYSINKQNIFNTVLLPLEAMETMKGFYAIIIDQYLWKNLPDDEKVSYLRQVIKSKCDNIDIPQCY